MQVRRQWTSVKGSRWLLAAIRTSWAHLERSQTCPGHAMGTAATTARRRLYPTAGMRRRTRDRDLFAMGGRETFEAHLGGGGWRRPQVETWREESLTVAVEEGGPRRPSSAWG